ncbi:MAG: hypothetical protein HY758_03905 [Nitrospirae bacterium]|nr:hypothetical protein [Nitrospirota bacterium]
MGKIIPFKANQSSEEKAFRKKLQTSPDDLETLTKLLILKIREGKFDPKSDYAKGIIRCIETANVEEINRFLINSSTEMHWTWKQREPLRINKYFAQQIYELSNIGVFFGKEWLQDCNATCFGDDRFLDDAHLLLPAIPAEESKESSTTSNINYSQVKVFFITCLKLIIAKHGLLELIAIQIVFDHCPILKEYPDEDINNFFKAYPFKQLDKNQGVNKIANQYMSSKLKDKELNFHELCGLLHLRYEIEGPFSDVCNAILDAIPKTSLDQIMAGIDYADTIFWEGYDIEYKPLGSRINSVFLEDFYNTLHENNKINNELAFNASLIFKDDLEICPLEYLVISSIYDMEELGDPFRAAKGFFAASNTYFNKGSYKESMTCLKTSLFNAACMFEKSYHNETPLDVIEMYNFIETTKKLNSYEDSINFLSKFKLLQERGLPIHQGFLNEIEAAKTKLEYEHNARTYHKIDEFYELVAKEDFPAVQSHVTESKGQFVLTRDQLQVLINKIQEKSDIIKALKSLSAKNDLQTYMLREIYDKQTAIFEVMKENQGSIENLITQNTEKIIENIHKKNETFASQINNKTVQDYYHGAIGTQLWKSLDEATRTFLMLARHLDTTYQFSPSDEFGFVAIEYAKAIENEFKRKIIDVCLSTGCQIKYKTQDKVRLIVCDTKITLGEICTLIDKTKKAKDGDKLLWQFSQFILNNTYGKQKLLDFKNELFQIKDKYRNPAAHPANYPRERLESFKGLLFEKGFLKDYLSCVQMEK